MRKGWVFCAALALVMCALSGCSLGSAESRSDGLQVVATVFPPYDLARAVAGGGAEVRMLIRPGVESHAYEPTPQDIMAIGAADVFLCIGGENEAWVERVLGAVDTSNLRIVRLIDCVEGLEEEDHEGQGHEEDHGIDEHIWTAPANAALMAQAIERAMSEADPERAPGYAANLDALMAQLGELDADYRSMVDGAARRELVFGDRFPFRYLAAAYGLQCYAAFPSCANDTEPSAKDMAALIERVTADGLPVIYEIEQSNGRVAGVIAEQTGADVLRLHSCHNVTASELENGETYLSLMRANLEAIRAGLY